VEGIVMAFDISLLILFIVLIFLILFRDKISSLFKEKPEKPEVKEGKRREEETSSITRRRREEKPTIAKKEPAAPKTPQREEIATKVEERPFQKEAPRAKTRVQNERAGEREKPAAQPKQTAVKTSLKPAPQKRVAPAQPQTVEPRAKPKPAPKPATPKTVPSKIYSDFDNSRLLSMGLSQEDADGFVIELIEQIDDHIPQIEAAIQAEEHEKVERLTHSLKGSATNLGTGGVADQLIEFNTYCKKGTDKEVKKTFLASLKANQVKLKEKYT
jgi:hypothetical protein